MTEQEKQNFLRYVNRPGKRQVKPTKYFFEFNNEENSEDDEDFALASESNEENGGSNSEASDDSEDDAGSDEEQDETSNDASVDIVDEKIEKKPLALCCICLEPEKPDMPICKCDRCQLMVHESCYGIIDEETESVSSGNELPWFCEPCMFGMVEPPYCEMCPNRFGAFKKTDVGGNWIHLTCAHYIEKTTFADADKFQGVSYQEIDHKQFGRKSCHGCTDKLEARVGIAVQCESGLCRNFYHPTCAQRLGLLVPMERHESDGHLLCKRHSLSEDVKARKKKFDIMMAYEEKRMIGVRKKKMGPDDDRKRERQVEEYQKRMKTFEGINVLHPGPNNAKRQRLFQSSAEVIEAFALKAELLMGIDRETYVKEFEKIPPENLNLAGEVSLTEDSIRYLEYRETVQFDEYEQYVEELKENKEEIVAKEAELTNEVNELKKNHEKLLISAEKVKNDLDYLYDQLNAFGAKGISRAYSKLPKKFAPIPVINEKKKQVNSKPPVLKPKMSPVLITLSDEDDDGPPVLKPNLPSKADVKYTCHQPPKLTLPKLTRITPNSSSASLTSPRKPVERPKPVPKARSKSFPDPSILKVCQKCKKDTDPQLMPFCEACNHYYHIGCLDPPLEKVPKQSRFYKWTCSDCNDEEAQKAANEEQNGIQSTNTTVETVQESDEENRTLAQTRKPRERATAIRVAREADYEESEGRNKRNSTSEVLPVMNKKRRLLSPKKSEKESQKNVKNDEVNAEMNGFYTEA